MGIVLKESIPAPPYSLHDTYVLELQAEGDTLHLLTQSGYTRTTAPCIQVDGDVEISGVDWESSFVYVMEYSDVLCGNCGAFTGKKLTVETFLKEFSPFTLEILDETYGYCQVRLEGFLNLPDDCLEFILALYYTGEFRYCLRS